MFEISIEYLGWIATATLLVGYYMNAKQLLTSWIVWFFGNLFMLIYALVINSYSVAFLSIALMALNIYGYRSWKQNK
jgi:nicotinamide riboside transporter PnuC